MLLDMFKEYKIDIEGNNENSAKEYVSNLRTFLNFLGIDENDNDKIIKINNNDVKNYIGSLFDINSAITRNHKLTIIKTFYKWLQQEEDKDIDYKILTIKYAKEQKKEKKWLNEEDCEKLILATSDLRTKAIIVLMITTGARLSDMSQIKLEDIYVPKGQDKHGNDIFASKVNGKGNKERYLFLDNQHYKTLEKLRKYAETKRKKIIEKVGKENEFLFISNLGEPIDHSNFRKSLKFYAKKANLNNYEEISPHTLRHSFATNLLENGKSISVVRDAMGHSSISTTNTYVHSNLDSVREAMER